MFASFPDWVVPAVSGGAAIVALWLVYKGSGWIWPKLLSFFQQGNTSLTSSVQATTAQVAQHTATIAQHAADISQIKQKLGMP